MLRNKTTQDIQKALTEGSYFKLADFAMTTADKNSGTVLRIEYKYNREYFFNVTIPLTKETIGTQQVFVVRGDQAPGEISGVEPLAATGLEGLTQSIQNWLKRLRTELHSAPALRQVSEQAKQLEDLVAEVGAFPDDYFSKEEAANLLARLSDLEERLKENLEQNINDKKELETKVTMIKEDIEMLRDNIGNLTKSNWLKALASRAFDWLKDPVNQKLLKSGAEVAKGLLEAGKNSVGSGS